MKRVLILLVLTLTACGGSDNTTEDVCAQAQVAQGQAVEAERHAESQRALVGTPGSEGKYGDAVVAMVDARHKASVLSERCAG